MITLKDVTKRYPDGTVAVGDLSIEMQGGEITVLLGSSGCGKTTTLRMINRLIEPTGGTIELDGRDLATVPVHELRRGIGYVIQQAGLFPHRTVADNIATVPKLLGWDRKRQRARALELIELVGLEQNMADRYPSQLSGGQQQRVGVARALAADPPVLLMDEPFGAVDPVRRGALQQEFKRLQRDLGKTVVFVTHDVDEAVLLGDRIAIMQQGGKVAQYGPPEALLAQPASEFVASFIGGTRGIKLLSLRPAADVPVTRDRPGRDRRLDAAHRRGRPPDRLGPRRAAGRAGRAGRPRRHAARPARLARSPPPPAPRCASTSTARCSARSPFDAIEEHLPQPQRRTRGGLDELGLARPQPRHRARGPAGAHRDRADRARARLLIAFPIGLIAYRWRVTYGPLLAITQILYTVPSLALFVLLINAVGLGQTPVIIGLTIYSLVILVRNLVEGLRAVPPDVIDAATAMGYPPDAAAVRVELPIALPDDHRRAAARRVSNISLVSVGALIGTGGLGQLFIHGFQIDNPIEIWTGIVVTILLALVLDLLIVFGGRLLTPWTRAVR